MPEWLRLVPVDFEGGGSWWDQLVAADFDPTRPAVVVSTGVTLYLTKEANAATLRQIAALAPGSTLAMTFLLPSELVDDVLRPGFEAAEKGARAAGTPFVSFYTPDEMTALAGEAGFREAHHIVRGGAERALLRRTDGRPADGAGRGTAGRGDLRRSLPGDGP